MYNDSIIGWRELIRLPEAHVTPEDIVSAICKNNNSLKTILLRLWSQRGILYFGERVRSFQRGSSQQEHFQQEVALSLKTWRQELRRQ